MNVLITGVNGYIGRNLIYRLKQEKNICKIIGIDKEIDLTELRKLNGDGIYYRLNLLDFDELLDFTRSIDIDVVFHLAGIKYARQSDLDYLNFQANNVQATINLVKTLSTKSIDKLIFSSSCSVYGPSELISDENSPLNPISVYARNKIDCENIIAETFKKLNVQIFIFRYFNVVGAETNIIDLQDKSPHGLFPNIYRSITSGCKLEIFQSLSNTKDNTCIRDYIDIRDLNLAHLKILNESKQFSKSNTNVYNIGSKNHYSSLEVVQKFSEVFGTCIDYDLKPSHLNEPAISLASYNKFESHYNWTPRYKIQDSIRTFF
jgi:UDP-glucose 4-epimerase